MKPLTNLFKIVLLLIGMTVVTFNVLLYNFCEKQKAETDAIIKQAQVDADVNNKKFKYQEDKIESLFKNLEDSKQQVQAISTDLDAAKDLINEQKDVLNAQKSALEDQKEASKSIQTSLVDIKAEADAIKQEMKSWQKDYVSVLAQLDKKMDESQYEIKSFEDNLTALNIPELKANINSIKVELEDLNHTPENVASPSAPAPENKIEHVAPQSS